MHNPKAILEEFVPENLKVGSHVVPDGATHYRIIRDHYAFFRYDGVNWYRVCPCGCLKWQRTRSVARPSVKPISMINTKQL